MSETHLDELPAAPQESEERSKGAGTAKRLEAAGWGTFLIWVGIAWIAGIDGGITLLGIAAITLVIQWLRRQAGLHVEGFWVMVGSCFAAAGVWSFVETDIPLLAVLMIVAGVAVLRTLFRRKG